MRLFLSILIGFLLFFAPFSFAAAEPWGFSVLQGGIGLCLLIWAISRHRWKFTPLMRPALGALVFLAGLSLLQALFPHTLLMPPLWHPATLMRLFTLEHASLFITYFTVIWLIGQLTKNEQAVRGFMLLGGLSGLAVGLCALCMSNGEYIYFFTGVRGGIGPFLNRNHASVFLAMSSLLTLGWVAAGFVHRPQGTDKIPFWLRQIFFLLVFFGLATGAVFTRSRGGILALLTGLFIFAFLCAGFIPSQLTRRLKYLLFTVILLGVCTGWIATHTAEINRFALREGGSSEKIRYMLYQGAREMLADYPVWGIGIGAMPVAITAYIPPTLNQYPERLHCDWLEILLGVGYAGAVPIIGCLIWFICLAFAQMQRLEKKQKFLFASLLSALTVMAAGSIVDFHFFIPANAFLFFVILGLVCSPAFDRERTSVHRPDWMGRTLFIVLFASACIIPGCKTAAWRLNIFGNGLKTPARIANAQQALKLYPAPRTALHLAVLYHNQSLKEQDPFLADELRVQAHELAELYLEKYPKEKELSRLYLLTQ